MLVQGTWLGIPWLGLVSLCQIWDFYGYSLNTLKYPKMGIRYFFLCCRTGMCVTNIGLVSKIRKTNGSWGDTKNKVHK